MSDIPNSIRLEDLAAQQGVTAITDLDELGSLWPADDDPDELMDFLLDKRAGRRSCRPCRF